MTEDKFEVSGFDDEKVNFGKYFKALNKVQDLIVFAFSSNEERCIDIREKNNEFVDSYYLNWGIENKKAKMVELNKVGVGYYLKALTTNLLETYDEKTEICKYYSFKNHNRGDEKIEKYRRECQKFKKELIKAIEKINEFYEDNWIAMAKEFEEFKQKNHIEPTKEELKKKSKDDEMNKEQTISQNQEKDREMER